MSEVRFEIVDLIEEAPKLDSLQKCREFFYSLGDYALRLAEEYDDGVPVVAILPVNQL